MPAAPVPASVIIPTTGRVELLRACLESIVACDPPPAEILVVDQSDGGEVAALVATLAPHGVRTIASSPRGIARAMNLGLREAAHDIVLRTDDDCTVAVDWVAVAWQTMVARPAGIVTGRVLPGGEGAWVPSLITDDVARDYDGEVVYGKLFTGNMAVDRRRALELGGLDERDGFRVAASDNDFGYRWLRAGRALRYEPAMVVWHHDWRTPRELVRRYAQYSRGQGVFYAKHLYEGDRRIPRSMAYELRRGLAGELRGLLRREPRASDESRAIIYNLPVGLVSGWLEARRLARAAPQPRAAARPGGRPGPPRRRR